MYRIIFVFFFFSGFSSLVFEVIWARMLQQVFGTTSFAISTLLTAFMAGLALGSIIGGRLADRVQDQLRLYGLLEAAIGVYALLVPVLLSRLPALYSLIFEHFIEDFYLFSLLRFVAVFLILLIPTTLMGATLPLVSQWIADRQRHFQGSIGFLYGANTLGACLGCFLAGFVLLPAFGLSITNTGFALVNFALAAVVIFAARRLRNQKPTAESPADELDDAELAPLIGGTPRAEAHPRWALRTTLILFGLTGVIAMSYQILWTRAYVITLGSSTYSFTLVLTAVLIGIALGSAAISPKIKQIARPIYILSLTQFGVAITATISFFLLDRIPLWLFERVRQTVTSAGEIYLYQFGLVALVVFLPSFLQGISFPLVIRAVTERAQKTGGDVGRAYAFNTTGAIIGSFAAGFILMPWLGMQRSIGVMITLNLLVAVALAVVELRLKGGPRRALVLGMALVTAVGLFFVAPPIDLARLSSGVFRVHVAREAFTPQSFENQRPEILYYEDGLTATTSVERRGGSIVLKANGKPEASDGADMATQVLVGLLPFIVRSGFEDVEIGDESAAMVGFGSGVTAGSSLQWPLEHIDVVEIEATMVEASRFFEHVNNRPLDDDRMNLVESDGRNYLEYTRQKFDVIISEPSNPWIAGVSSLFTVEFFQSVRQKLNPGGVYAQWVQLYELRPENVRRVFATFQQAFPYVHAFSSKPKSTDLILIGSDRPLVFPAEGYQRAWEIKSVRRELERVEISTIHDLYGLLFMTHRELLEFSEGAEFNTDDNGLLEFEAPRDLIFYKEGEQFFAQYYFRVHDHGDPRPYLDDWPDGPQWTPQAVAALARAIWVAGKSLLAEEILEDAGFLSHEPHVESVFQVLSATQLSLPPFLDHHWPHPDSPIHGAVLRIAAGEDPGPILKELSSDRSEELKLLNTMIRAEARDWRRAARLIDELGEDGGYNDNPVYLLLRANILERRRRYWEAYDAYLQLSQVLRTLSEEQK